MVLRRAGVKYEDVTIENIWSQFGLAPALKEGKVDAIVSWEPYVTQALTQVPDTYRGDPRRPAHVLRDGRGRARADGRDASRAVIKSIAAGLAQSSHFTRNNPDEAVEIFAKWVPGTDVAIGKKSIKHIHFDPRMSPKVLQAFENAEDEVLTNTLKGAPRLDVPSLFRPEFMQRGRERAPGIFRGSAEVEVRAAAIATLSWLTRSVGRPESPAMALRAGPVMTGRCFLRGPPPSAHAAPIGERVTSSP